MVDLQAAFGKIYEMIIIYAPKLVMAIIVLILGLWIIKGIKGMMIKFLRKRKVDPTLRPFLVKLSTALLKVMLIIAVLGMIGIEMASFIAVLAAAGFAIGMALQGSLANFAGGVLILLFRPFKVGHYIEAQGEAGTVEEISIFTTTLKTPDNKTVIIPNGPLANGNMTNYTMEKKRRVDFTFGIGYEDDIKKARKVILEVLAKDKRILKDPKPVALVAELADSSVNLSTRVWVKTDDYWNVFFENQEKVKYALDKAKINIPYPQMDVHMQK